MKEEKIKKMIELEEKMKARESSTFTVAWFSPNGGRVKDGQRVLEPIGRGFPQGESH